MHDQVSDKNHAKLHQIGRELGLPDFVKEAYLEDEESIKDLPSRAFADKDNRRYPINNKANTWMSCAFFYKFGRRFVSNKEVIDEMLHKAADLWGITEGELQSLQDKIEANLSKEASQAPCGVEMQLRHQGQVVDTLFVLSAEQTQKIASELFDKPQRFTYEMRKSAAEGLLKAAKLFNVKFDAPTYRKLEKTAGKATCTVEDAAGLVKRRVLLYQTKYPEVSERLQKVASEIEKTEQDGLVPPAVLEKVAAMIDASDRVTNTHRHYAGKLSVPELELYRWTEKDARDVSRNAVILNNGDVIPGQLLTDNYLKIRDLMNDVWNLKTASMDEMLGNVDKLSSQQAYELAKELGI